MDKIIDYTPEQLRQIQLCGLEMMIEVDRICWKNNIKYSMAGGTLIGAARHKGFIPWDDDVDVMFTPIEYEKFCEACKTDLDESRFFFQDYRTDKEYRWSYGKLRRLGTEYIKAGYENAKFRTGVCIDVFDYEYLPDGKIKRMLYRAEMFLVRKMQYSQVGRTRDKKAINRFMYSLLYKIPKAAVFKYREHITSLYVPNESSRIYNIMLPPKRKECDNGFPREWFEEFTELEFEGMLFPALKEYDKFLSVRYGDYMKLPPVEMRKGVMEASKLELLDLNLEDLQEIYRKGRQA